MKKTGSPYLYPILETEIKKRHIKKVRIAELLNIQKRTLSKKLNGEIKFSLEEGLLIWKTWFSDIPIDELYRKNEPTEARRNDIHGISISIGSAEE